MAKFARYIFIIFILTLVVPIVAMFFYAHHQMEKVEKYGKEHLIETAKLEIQTAMQNYLKLKSAEIIQKLYENKKEYFTKSDIIKIFPDKQIAFTNENIKKISGNFRLKYVNERPFLYYRIVVPVPSKGFKAIIVSKKIKFSDIEINGPFQLELYSGNEVSAKNFAGMIADKNIVQRQLHPKTPLDGAWNMKPGIPENKNAAYKIIKLNKGNPDAELTVLIKTNWPHPSGKPIEGKIGLIILLAAIFTSIASALYVSRNFINPYLTLSYATKRVKKGDLDFTIDSTAKQKEVQNTYNNFNRMIKSIKEKEDLRSSFIRNLTHDLRTPLIAQERALYLISDKFKSLNMAEEVELSKSLEKNASHLLRMVNLILESYQFNLREEDLTPVDINLKTLVNESYIKIKPLADEKNIYFENKILDNFSTLRADYTCMERILINLISNAIENLGKFGVISVEAENRQDNIIITVSDNGVGISKEDVEHVFDRYYSGKSYNRKLGSGLGLDVCKKLITAHGGTISIESEVGKYTKFMICLPNKRENAK